jgi:hypothetical protein
MKKLFGALSGNGKPRCEEQNQSMGGAKGKLRMMKNGIATGKAGRF